MRWNLLKTYDKIYTIDLHGNSKKKEVCPDGGIDQNVFDIMQGVSINLFIKTGKKKSNELGRVFHFDLYGKREDKYDFLLKNSVSTIPYKEISNKAPNYFMVQKDFDAEKKYLKGFLITELFPINSVGIVTARDSFTIHNTQQHLKNTINKFLSLDDEDARNYFKLGKDVRDWQVNFARKDLVRHYPDNGSTVKVAYRLFDDRWTFYTGKSKGFHCYPRNEVMKNFIGTNNLGIAMCKQFKSGNTYQHVFITNKIIESSFVSNKTSEITSLFPLYVYSESEDKLLENKLILKPNLKSEIVEKISKKIEIPFVTNRLVELMDNTTEKRSHFSPTNFLDYIYAVLHSSNYRNTFKEFLKIDFPRIPYPQSKQVFWNLVELGAELRAVHLLESPKVEEYITQYPISGNNLVENLMYENEKVYINEEQYFANVSQVVWDFPMGGYQPAQKWLKDRKGNILSFEDILHYQKIIVALNETNNLMLKIDEIDFM